MTRAQLASDAPVKSSTATSQTRDSQAATAGKATTETSPDQPVTTVSVQVKVVNVFATARDKHGKIVNGLAKDDFTLTEDGRPQGIRYFARETDIPLTLGLLVDTSMSQRRVLGQERSASQSFLNQMVREDKDKAFVIHFDREVELLQDLTSSHEKLEAALQSLEAPQFTRTSGGNSPGAGGGSDPGSNPGSGRGSGRQRGGRRFPEQDADGKKVLERISKETGGRLFEVSKKEPVDQIYSQIQEELRNQYSLGYTPDRGTGAESGYHKIQVAAKQRDVVVQAREG